MKGRCMCGAVTFELASTPKGVSVCHCGQCRRQSGHLWASAFLPREDIRVKGEVRWHRSSESAERGFCPRCGSFLFWRADGEGTQSVAMGALEEPTGLSLEKHIFTADKGDYYDLPDDGLPRS